MSSTAFWIKGQVLCVEIGARPARAGVWGRGRAAHTSSCVLLSAFCVNSLISRGPTKKASAAFAAFAAEAAATAPVGNILAQVG